MGNGYATEMTYNFGEIAGCVGAIESFCSQMQADLDDVKSQVTAKTANWQGDTKSVFEPYFAKWDQGARDLHTCLTTWAMKTSMASEAMGTTDKGLSSRLFGGG